MQLKFERPVDIIASVAWSVILLILIIFNIRGAIRIIFGLPFVIFIPGYLLVLLLFPTNDEIDVIERIALSFGLSIAVVPLVGLALNYTPWGIRLASVTTALALLVFAFAALATWRWYSAPPDKRFKIEISIELPQNRIERVLSIALIISIILSISLLIYLIATPRQGEKFTEFYILGPNGKAANYPTNISTNETARVIIGIANHEEKTINYSVETWLLEYNSYIACNGHGYAISNISKPFKAATIEAWVNASKEDTAYCITYEMENYSGNGEIYGDESIKGIKLIPGVDNRGYICSIKLPKMNGPVSISLRSKITSGNGSVWKLEVYEGKNKKWEYEVNSDKYKRGVYEWISTPVWFFHGSKSYKIKIYWSGGAALYLDKLSINAYRGAIGKDWPCIQAIVFKGIAKDKLRIGYFTKMDNGYSNTWFNAYLPKDNKFHLVSVTFQNGTKKCYVDGIPIDSVNAMGELSENESKVVIGGGYGFFFGCIDDVRIYNRALKWYEVQQNYKCNITKDGLMAWWKFDEGYGKIAHDCIAGNKAILDGCQWQYGNIMHMWFMDKIATKLNSTKVNIEKEWKPQWEYNYNFSIKKRGFFKMVFLLFMEDNQTFIKWHDYPGEADRIENAYRECHLWIRVHS